MNSGIAEKVIGDLLNVRPDIIEKFDMVFIDLNSMLSAIFYKTVIDEIKRDDSLTEIKIEITSLFAQNFLSKYAHKEIIFYGKDLTKEYFLRKLYSKWRIYDKKDDTCKIAIDIWEHLLYVLRRLETMMSIRVDIKETDEHGWAPIEYVLKNKVDKKALIVSRDPMALLNCSYAENLYVWNGKMLYYRDSYALNATKKGKLEYTSFHPAMLSTIYLLAGVDKLGYKGINKIGLSRAAEIIIENNITQLEDLTLYENEKVKEMLNNVTMYKPLFSLYDYLTLKEGKIYQYKRKDGYVYRARKCGKKDEILSAVSEF